jgi:UDPglucose--hexose-1-phosphate uridylyltransferase
MPEFRQDLVTGDWVIMAQDRAHRPYDHGGGNSACPFCPHNEERTPPAVLTLEGDTGWSVRVVPNKYPALTPEGAVVDGRIGPYATRTGVGFHDVVVESPEHDLGLATYTVEHLAQVMAVWAERYSQLAADPRVQYVQILRNHGRRAGASREHPHSQIMAMPFVPDRVRLELNRAHSYWSTHNGCMFCEMIEHELEAEARIVMADSEFVAMAPFAPKMPFETWILPVRHQASFGQLDSAGATALARVLGALAKAMNSTVSDVPHNLVLRTSPTQAAPDEWGSVHNSYHWRLEMVPRLSTPAGFEIGTGVFVNVATPEDAAKQLKTAICPV